MIALPGTHTTAADSDALLRQDESRIGCGNSTAIRFADAGVQVIPVCAILTTVRRGE